MRRPILISALSCALLSLAACGGNKVANNAAVTDESAAGEAIITNDVTAIDAASGEAANMAPDVNYTFNEETLARTNAGGNASPTAKPARPPAKKAPKPAAPAPAAAGNSAASAINAVSQ